MIKELHKYERVWVSSDDMKSIIIQDKCKAWRVQKVFTSSDILP